MRFVIGEKVEPVVRADLKDFNGRPTLYLDGVKILQITETGEINRFFPEPMDRLHLERKGIQFRGMPGGIRVIGEGV